MNSRIDYLQPMNTKPLLAATLGIALIHSQVAAGDEGFEIRALLAPTVETLLSSQIAARIKNITVTDGAAFRQGKRLLQFDCVVPNAQLRKARAEYQAAKMQLEANRNLKKHKAIGRLEVVLAETKVDKSRAEVSLVQARVGMCQVHAPFAGRVVKLHVHPHQSVRAGEPLMEILDDRKLKMELIVPSLWLRWLKTGATFSVRIDEVDKDYPAVVTMLGARVDPVSQTLPVTAEIRGEYAELLAGMSGTADLSMPQ